MNALRALEQEVLQEGREYTRRLLEIRLQEGIERIGAICPHSGLLLQEVSYRPLVMLSVVGWLRLKAAYGYSSAQGTWLTPARVAWAMTPGQRTSPELQARLAQTATACRSFEKAARTASLWGTPISDDLVHAQVQKVGRKLVDNPATDPAPHAKKSKFSMVLMMDGWMVRERGKDWGKKGRRPGQCRVQWHEVKSAVMFRLEDQATTRGGRGWLIEKHVVLREPETEPLVFGKAVQTEAIRGGLAEAEEVYLVMDGAVWLWCLREDRFKNTTPVLDFHHASQHLWALAFHRFGDKTDEQKAEARAWVEPLLHDLRHGKEKRVIRSLEELLLTPEGRQKKVKTEGVQIALQKGSPSGGNQGTVVDHLGFKVRISMRPRRNSRRPESRSSVRIRVHARCLFCFPTRSGSRSPRTERSVSPSRTILFISPLPRSRNNAGERGDEQSRTGLKGPSSRA